MRGPRTNVVDAIRAFNRFYTTKIGILRDDILESPFSLTEVRVLYELAHREKPAASELCTELGLDAGYLSRILRRFEDDGLVDRKRSAEDARRSTLALTRNGRAAFARLNDKADDEIQSLLGGLSAAEQTRLAGAMGKIRSLLGERDRKVPYLLRTHRPGDMGWVLQSHGAFYAREYGWNEEFEALVAGIVASFIKTFDPSRERCWIAERDGENVGSVFLVKKRETVAQLRLLLVDPSARGLGIGARLVEECTEFARRAGYRKIVLWTNDVLVSARRIYEAAGYQLTSEEPHHSFGKDLVGQLWALKL